MIRFSGWWLSPNMAGLDLATLLVLVVGLTALAWKRWKVQWYWLPVPTACMVALAGLLVMTGSRAAWLAAGTGFTMLAAGGILRWRTVAGIAALVVAGSLLVPGAGERVAHTFEGDSAIAQRFALWRAHAALIADHRWTGLTAGEYGIALDTWYLPDALRGRFASGLNDLLTLAARWGWPVAAVTVILFGAWSAHVWWYARRHPFATVIAAVLLVRLVAGCFQAHAWVGSTAWPTIGLLALWLGHAVVIWVRTRRQTGSWVSARLAPALLGGAAGALVAIIAGVWALAIAQQHDVETMRHAGHVIARERTASGASASAPPLLLIRPDYARVGRFARRWCDPLLANGWAVGVATALPQDSEPWIVVAWDQDAAAGIESARIQSLIALELARLPRPESVPASGRMRELVVLHAERGLSPFDVEDARDFCSSLEATGARCRLTVVDGAVADVRLVDGVAREMAVDAGP